MFTCWWFQPIWKKVKMGSSSPIFGVKIPQKIELPPPSYELVPDFHQQYHPLYELGRRGWNYETPQNSQQLATLVCRPLWEISYMIPCIVYIFFSCTYHNTNKPTCMYTFLLLRTWILWEIQCLPKESRHNDDWKTYNCMSEAGVSFSGVSLFKCCVLRGFRILRIRG